MIHVKICGITNLEDALVAAEAGADLLGFVFFSRSPRYIEPARAREIVSALRQRDHAPSCVGVFVNESPERVREIAATAQLDAVQLHGDESPEMVRDLCTSTVFRPRSGEGPRSGAIEILRPFGPQNDTTVTHRAYKALRPRNEAEAQALVNQYRAAVNGNTPAFIVDAFDAQRFGGTGARADWSIAAAIAREFPILLAGGLSADNVADAVRAARPWGVDVSSGVERAPGEKDHDKVRQFIQIAQTLTS
jgi:phosphoribosylanthranilate isomerase